MKIGSISIVCQKALNGGEKLISAVAMQDIRNSCSISSRFDI